MRMPLLCTFDVLICISIEYGCLMNGRYRVLSGTKLYEKNSVLVIGLEKYTSTSYKCVISIYICIYDMRIKPQVIILT